MQCGRLPNCPLAIATGPTRISIPRLRAPRHATEAAALMAGPLGWNSRQTAREVEHYQGRIAAERAAQEASDDQAADAIRLGAPDIVPLVGITANGR